MPFLRLMRHRRSPALSLGGRRAAHFGAGCAIILLIGVRVLAQPIQAPEPQVKAAFLYNFAQLATWPTNAFAGSNSPIVIGVLGKDTLKEELDRLNGLKAGGHIVRVARYIDVANATNCHVLFISDSERRKFDAIFDALRHAPILTVGDSRGFSTRGMIELIRAGDGFDFRINLEAANTAGLRLSSRLTRLDRRLRVTEPEPTNSPGKPLRQTP
jgi:hypothetical protein